MGVSTVQSAAVFGLRVELVNVEADVGNGLPAFHMVGYLSSEVKEPGNGCGQRSEIPVWNFRQRRP